MKILNFGSLNIDYTYRVEEFAKKGETISSKSFKKNWGGKGSNQAIALSRAGLSVYHAGSVGEDGLEYIEFLKRNNINTEYINISKLPTGTAFIEVDNTGNNRIVIYPGANNDITIKYINKVLVNFKKGDYIFLQNEIANIPYIINKAYIKGINIVFNPSPVKGNLKEIDFNKISYLVINEVEGESLTGRKTPNEILKSLLTTYPDIKIILTLGNKGSIYKDKYEEIYMDIYKSKVVDTTCAGDTFTGYFFAGLFSKKDLEWSLRYATRAASIKVGREGASSGIPDKEEVNI